ncbi:PEGA domain-containing protein [Polyangium aurulentum]|uniref:PEGA domain-containing protein n=1 Tax=Polyangium aurulentum TaxID=2567896 RepID=UPI0010AE9E22|nr:PEGA domain-containing protein [Polyangium aurulentum]UQA61376.1 PEGA domain-containing protein [Polyangium aurulentum]
MNPDTEHMRSETGNGRRGLGVVVALGVLFAASTVTGSVQAQGAGAANAPAAAKPQRDKEAQRLFKEGVAAANKDDNEKGIALIKAAIARDPQSEYIIALGTTEMNADKFRDAAEHLWAFLNSGQPIDPADRKEAEEMLAEAQAKIGTMTVRVEPAGADVLVDGAKVGVSPVEKPIFVEVGQRKVQAIKEGMAPASQVVDVAAGGKPAVELKLGALGGSGGSGGSGGGTVVQPPQGGERSKGLIYAGVGVSAALAVVGVGGVVGWWVKYGDANSIRDNCRGSGCQKNFDDAESMRVNFAYMSLAGFVGAGVIGGATAIYALTGKKSDDATKPNVSLMMGPEGSGLVVSGKW